MKQYRTHTDYLEICENAYNGNWTDAQTQYAKACFSVQDFVNFMDDDAEQGIERISKEDLAYIVEGAWKLKLEGAIK